MRPPSLFLLAQIQALTLGHRLGSFQSMEGKLHLATCSCGALAFIDRQTGEAEGFGPD